MFPLTHLFLQVIGKGHEEPLAQQGGHMFLFPPHI
jgi:hypothetical protein